MTSCTQHDTKAKDNLGRFQVIPPPGQEFRITGDYPSCKRIIIASSGEEQLNLEVDPKCRRVKRDMPPV